MFSDTVREDKRCYLHGYKGKKVLYEHTEHLLAILQNSTWRLKGAIWYMARLSLAKT